MVCLSTQGVWLQMGAERKGRQEANEMQIDGTGTLDPTVTSISVSYCRLAEGGSDPHGPLPHPLLPLLHPIHVPALHHEARRALLRHRLLPALHQ